MDMDRFSKDLDSADLFCQIRIQSHLRPFIFKEDHRNLEAEISKGLGKIQSGDFFNCLLFGSGITNHQINPVVLKNRLHVFDSVSDQHLPSPLQGNLPDQFPERPVMVNNQDDHIIM